MFKLRHRIAAWTLAAFILHSVWTIGAVGVAQRVRIGRVAEAVLTIDFLYDTGAKGPHKPVLRNVLLEKVTSTGSPRVMWVVGFPGAVVENVRFSDCSFSGIEAADVMQDAGSVSFKNERIIPAKKGRSLNSLEATH